MPRKTTEPIPADIRPGSKISGSIGPPSPAASMRMIAPMTGEPKTVAIAANAALAASTAMAWSGVSFLTRRTARTARPEPKAMSGASGPSTRPRPRVASAASRMPGRSAGWVAPALSPSYGMCPPWPGSRMIATAASTPATASTGSGHHHGTGCSPSPLGRCWYTSCWIQWTSSRKHHEANETSTPSSAARTSRTR